MDVKNFEILSSENFIFWKFLLVLADLGARSAPVSARTPNRWNRTNANFEQTETSHKPKLRANLNFAKTQTSNKSKLRTNPNFEQIQISNKPKSFWQI